MSSRINRLRELLEKNTLDSFLVSNPHNILYLSGFSSFSSEEREAYLLITKNAQFIFTDGRYSEAVSKKLTNFELIEISSQRKTSQALSEIISSIKLKKIGFEVDNLSVLEYKVLSKKIKGLTGKPDLIENLRQIKENDEIKNVSKACAIGDLAFKQILGRIQEGVSEKQLAFDLSDIIRKNLTQISFDPIIAFGSNSSVPHHAPSDRKLAKNEIVLMDFGVRYESYCSDMTRTVFFGKADERFKKIYNTVLESQQKALEFLNHKSSIINLPAGKAGRKSYVPIIKASEIDKAARDYIVSKGFPAIPHSVGHGIGIQVHEIPHLSPSSKGKLKPNMIFSVEPGIYIPSFGGVRIEDLVLLTESSAEELTKSRKDLIEIE